MVIMMKAHKIVGLRLWSRARLTIGCAALNNKSPPSKKIVSRRKRRRTFTLPARLVTGIVPQNQVVDAVLA